MVRLQCLTFIDDNCCSILGELLLAKLNFRVLLPICKKSMIERYLLACCLLSKFSNYVVSFIGDGDKQDQVEDIEDKEQQ